MGFRMWRRIRIAPGITLNLSKTGASVSIGPRGAKYTIGTHGSRVTAGIPGTGLYYTEKLHTGGSRGREAAQQPQQRPIDRLNLGFFRRIFTPKDEQELVEGTRQFMLEDYEQALSHLQQALTITDAAFLSGAAALNLGRLDDAAKYFESALTDAEHLSAFFGKYGIMPQLQMPITPEVTAVLGPDTRGVCLLLTEVYQGLDRLQDAVTCVKRLLNAGDNEVVVRLSLAELLLEPGMKDSNTCKEVVQLAKDVENESFVHTALLLYKAEALICLGMEDAAKDTLTYGLRRKKGRPAQLLHEMLYQRAMIFLSQGQNSRARKDLERIFAQDPDFMDVSDQLQRLSS